MTIFKPLLAAFTAAISFTGTAAFALEACETLDRVIVGDIRYGITQQAKKKGDKIERVTSIYLPASAKYISDVNLRTNFKTTMIMREMQTRTWTMELTPNGPKYESTPTRYSFLFVLTQNRPNKDAMPNWSKDVEDKSLNSCIFYKNGEEEVFRSSAQYGLICTLTISDEVKAKMKGLQSLEVRGRNRKSNEILRAQYSVQYPQAVKTKMAQSGPAMDDAVAKGRCVPLEK